MIFLTVGLFLAVIGILFLLFPAKYGTLFYGYHSILAKKNETIWRKAQKISGRLFLLTGIVMSLIGELLRYFGWTNYFLIEMLVLVFPIMPIFIITENKLTSIEQKQQENGEE